MKNKIRKILKKNYTPIEAQDLVSTLEVNLDNVTYEIDQESNEMMSEDNICEGCGREGCRDLSIDNLCCSCNPEKEYLSQMCCYCVGEC